MVWRRFSIENVTVLFNLDFLLHFINEYPMPICVYVYIYRMLDVGLYFDFINIPAHIFEIHFRKKGRKC